MTYPKTPECDADAIKYARYLESIHGGVKHVPIRRKEKIKSIFSLNFMAVSERDFSDWYYLEWDKIE